MSGPVTSPDDAPAEGAVGDTTPLDRFGAVPTPPPLTETAPPPWSRSDG